MSEPIAANSEPPRGQGLRILYLDDEEPLVFLVTRMLRSLGYRPEGFSKAADALAAFQLNPGEFALVLTDLSMPGTTGLEFAKQVLAVSPAARVVIASGALDAADQTRARAIGVLALIEKPATVEELGQTVRRLLEGSQEPEAGFAGTPPRTSQPRPA
jgi:DNA-binding NtrC family response regulator